MDPGQFPDRLDEAKTIRMWTTWGLQLQAGRSELVKDITEPTVTSMLMHEAYFPLLDHPLRIISLPWPVLLSGWGVVLCPKVSWV